MSWGPGPWMWGFWWVMPLMGLLLCIVVMAVMVRAMRGGHGFACMGGHPSTEGDVVGELRREIRELREEIGRLRAQR